MTCTSIQPGHRIPKQACGFTLIELLCVLAVFSLMTYSVIPVVSYLKSGNMKLVESESVGLLQGARQFAVANCTYVRVGFAEVADSGGIPKVVIQCIHSTHGTMRYDATGQLNNESFWKTTDKPVVLTGVQFDQTLIARAPQAEILVSGLEQKFTPFHRNFQGKALEYRCSIQFDPMGQVSVEPGKPMRMALIGLRSPQRSSDPIGLLLTGASGRVQSLRRENFTP